ncbi:MAG: hypothetical protein A2887_03185 [Alphaproteobacteria bacterium RIFCSPLOWO2_01_FULL_40_26]|nr:MAG: hypothetical protein A3D15_02335 [Alphaproteobacteria bacterium RIFCSPHIGHO2_02_FULL_40_34]OFW88930.1 MAG: hypothetical protein A2794_03320 [Alphaproteobacteria bacterium RIFCSPHIGHO2_01_FULL_40_8]OFW95529.1 MAG: hypothetical protein A2887_03185 [Alphaproteobacteria bacterium RIFCSPLOWO2_01_FULL_40_26]OFX09631.1 MAG: hypothetical protein A3H30_05200 [Alphaproteobacteria bacterium RIFCSPLOWO2_02_FULL_40_19]OFX11344.1 MAG: hypothetical protein A3G22_05505 [Alphaproteobacteria bacterium RI
MTLEQKIKKFSQRKTLLSKSEINQRKKELENFRAISVFEGFTTSKLDKKIFDLLIYQKISPSDYLSLCLELSHEKH